VFSSVFFIRNISNISANLSWANSLCVTTINCRVCLFKNEADFVFWVFIVSVPFNFSLFHRWSNNKSPQRWRSRIKQQIVWVGNEFNIFFASSVLKIASKDLGVKLCRVSPRPCKLALQPSRHAHGVRKSCRDYPECETHRVKSYQTLYKLSRGTTWTL